MQSDNNKPIPQHVSVIMDGNGRWAEANSLERVDGHKAGVESLKKCVMAARRIGVRYLTVYAFSTENWGRPKEEVDAIMELFSMVVIEQAKELAKNSIRLKFIGNKEELNVKLQEQIKVAEAVELPSEEMTLVVALNYSARWDIVNAAKCLAAENIEITQSSLQSKLSTGDMPDVDLVVRTSGEQRLSNFMLWESSYAELYFTDKLWPEFGEDDFEEAINWYRCRDRRFGVRKK